MALESAITPRLGPSSTGATIIELPGRPAFKAEAQKPEIVKSWLQTAQKTGGNLPLGRVEIGGPFFSGLAALLSANSDQGDYTLSISFSSSNSSQIGFDHKHFAKPEPLEIDDFTTKLKELTMDEYTLVSNELGNLIIQYNKPLTGVKTEDTPPFFMLQVHKSKEKGSRVGYILDITDKLTKDGIERFENHYKTIAKLTEYLILTFHEGKTVPRRDFTIGPSVDLEYAIQQAEEKARISRQVDADIQRGYR